MPQPATETRDGRTNFNEISEIRKIPPARKSGPPEDYLQSTPKMPRGIFSRVQNFRLGGIFSAFFAEIPVPAISGLGRGWGRVGEVAGEGLEREGLGKGWEGFGFLRQKPRFEKPH